MKHVLWSWFRADFDKTLHLKEMFEWHKCFICCDFVRVVEILSEKTFHSKLSYNICACIYAHQHKRGEFGMLS